MRILVSKMEKSAIKRCEVSILDLNRCVWGYLKVNICHLQKSCYLCIHELNHKNE